MMISRWVILFLLTAFVTSLWRLERRLQAVESLLMGLSRHVGVLPPLATEPSQRVKELALDPGRQVEAVRAVREEMGLDLKAARAIVKSLASHTLR
jgi:ribosomal protein L7/L12